MDISTPRVLITCSIFCSARLRRPLATPSNSAPTPFHLTSCLGLLKLTASFGIEMSQHPMPASTEYRFLESEPTRLVLPTHKTVSVPVQHVTTTNNLILQSDHCHVRNMSRPNPNAKPKQSFVSKNSASVHEHDSAPDRP